MVFISLCDFERTKAKKTTSSLNLFVYSLFLSLFSFHFYLWDGVYHAIENLWKMVEEDDFKWLLSQGNRPVFISFPIANWISTGKCTEQTITDKMHFNEHSAKMVAQFLCVSLLCLCASFACSAVCFNWNLRCLCSWCVFFFFLSKRIVSVFCDWLFVEMVALITKCALSRRHKQFNVERIHSHTNTQARTHSHSDESVGSERKKNGINVIFLLALCFPPIQKPLILMFCWIRNMPYYRMRPFHIHNLK